MKFGDLEPGDVLTLAGQSAVVLAIQNPHPLNPRFLLIIWWIFSDKRLSFDMLAPGYQLIEGSRVSRDGMTSYRQAMREIE